MALISCSECGKQVSDKAAACPNCGAPVKKEQERKPCPECNELLPNGAATCPGCGAPVATDTASVQQPPNQSSGIGAGPAVSAVASAGPGKTPPAPEWLVQKGQETLGPFTSQQVKDALLEGHFSLGVRVKRDGDSDFERITRVAVFNDVVHTIQSTPTASAGGAGGSATAGQAQTQAPAVATTTRKRAWVQPVILAVIGVIVLGGLVPFISVVMADPSKVAAATAIKDGVGKTETATCQVKLGEGFEKTSQFQMSVGRTNYYLDAICTDSQSSSARDKACMDALAGADVLKTGYDKNKPNCLVMNTGELSGEHEHLSATFPCGTHSIVDVQEITKEDDTHARVSYRLLTERTPSFEAVESRCVDYQWPSAKSRKVTLVKVGSEWKMP